MNVAAVITYVLAIVAAISAAAILFAKEVFHAAMLLIVCLLCVAGIFVTFNAEFMAIVQLMVYAGGILVLIIFGIMITVREPQDHSNNKFISAIIGLALFAMMVYSITPSLPANAGNPVFEDGIARTSRAMAVPLSPESIGTLLITTYAIPFELAGVLLLISLIGAIVAATSKDHP